MEDFHALRRKFLFGLRDGKGWPLKAIRIPEVEVSLKALGRFVDLLAKAYAPWTRRKWRSAQGLREQIDLGNLNDTARVTDRLRGNLDKLSAEYR